MTSNFDWSSPWEAIMPKVRGRTLWHFRSAIAAAISLSTVLAASAYVAAATNYHYAVKVTFSPGMQDGTPQSGFSSVSCVSAGNCTAAGQFSDAASNYEAMTQTERNFIWRQATRAIFARGVQSASPRDSFTSIACVAIGNCTAAGYFIDRNGHARTMTQTERNGVWRRAVPTSFPPGVHSLTPDDLLTSIACVSVGNCTVAGRFLDASGNYEAMTDTEKNGIWKRAVPASYPPGAHGAAFDDLFWAVACVSIGNCTAAGRFRGATGQAAATETEKNGVWKRAVPNTFAPGVGSVSTSDYFDAIACTSIGNCTAAGQYRGPTDNDVPGGVYRAMTQTERNGVWNPAVPANFAPGVQPASGSDAFTSIACVSAGNCTAAGRFRPIVGNYEAMTETERNGVWNVAIPATFAVGTQGRSSPLDFFYSIDCVTVGNCVAAGSFGDITSWWAMTESEVNGIWKPAVPVKFAPGVHSTGAEFNSIFCVSIGNCVAAGDFADPSGNGEAMTQTLSTR